MGIRVTTGQALLALAVCASALHGVARADEVDEPAGNNGNNSFNNQFTYWAAVTANGAIKARRGLAGVTKSGTGQYVVTFKTNITGCLFNATITSLSGAFPVVGQVAVVQTQNKAASVATYNASGSGTDQDFYLVATCPPAE